MGKNITHYLKDIMEKVFVLNEKHRKFYSTELLIAYRGESQDYGDTKLMPSLFRDTSYIEKEKYLFELICDYEMLPYDKRNIDKAIDAQHYVEISRMLDITFNSIISIYFACTNLEKDGTIFIFGFPDHYSPHSKYVEEFYSNILSGINNITYSKNFKVFSHSYANERIKAQYGGFIFFPGMVFNPISDVYYETVKVKASDKKLLLEDIHILFQINKAQLFPEKENIANVIKEKFKKNVYCDKQLNIQSELDNSLERIDYELSLMKDKNKIDVLRKLRKEKYDLIYYINNINDKNDSKVMLEKIEKYFDSFELLF